MKISEFTAFSESKTKAARASFESVSYTHREAHAKLRPVESPTAVVFLSGVCQGPKDIPETVAQAGAAAVKAIGLLAKDKLMTNPCTAKSLSLIHI